MVFSGDVQYIQISFYIHLIGWFLYTNMRQMDQDIEPYTPLYIPLRVTGESPSKIP